MSDHHADVITGNGHTVVITPTLSTAAKNYLDRTIDQDAYIARVRLLAERTARTEVERAVPTRRVYSALVFLSSGLATALALLLPPGPLAITGAALAGGLGLLIAIAVTRGDATSGSDLTDGDHHLGLSGSHSGEARRAGAAGPPMASSAPSNG